MTGRNKKIAAAAASGFLLFVCYYGSYLPVRKSEMYVYAERKIANASSMNDVIDILSAPLDQPSPIGQEDLLKRSAELVGVLIDKYGAKAPTIVPPLIHFLERYRGRYAARGPSVSSDRIVFVMANANLRAYAFLHQQQYLDAARRYYELGLANGPRLPRFIYPLFDVYILEGNLDGAKAMGNLIVTYWPEDYSSRSKVVEGIADLERRARRPSGSVIESGRE
jgi:hypothetical protein